MSTGYDAMPLMGMRTDNEEKVDMMKRYVQRQMGSNLLKAKKAFEEQKIQKKQEAMLLNAAAVPRFESVMHHGGPANNGNHLVRPQHQPPEFSQPGFMAPTGAPTTLDHQATGFLSRSGLSSGHGLMPQDEETRTMLQFQEKVFQLDVCTRMNLQNSLYRLSRSAKDRQEIQVRSASQSPSDFDHKSAMDIVLDSCLTRQSTISEQQPRNQMETTSNPVDRMVANMLFSPLCPPDQDYLPERAPTSGIGTKTGNHDRWQWTGPGLAANDWKVTPDNLKTHDHGGAASLKDSHMGNPVDFTSSWTASPLLTDYHSPSGALTSSVELSRFEGDSIASSTAAPPTVRGFAAAQPLNMQPRPRNYYHSPPSSMTTESHSSGRGGQLFGSGQHTESENQGERVANRRISSMNSDILQAALRIQSRLAAAASHQELFQPSHTTAGFSPLQYESGSQFRLTHDEKPPSSWASSILGSMAYTDTRLL